MLAVTDDKEERKHIIEMFKNGRNKNSETVDLPYLLQKLDGLESSEGRIIIATTNNPELINPVLLRPGRFDLKLCLSNCTSQMYVDILSAFYELDEEGRKTILKERLPEKKWSPLQVINTCLTTNSFNSTLKTLNK
jgi:chaperone BCS1